MCHEVLMVNYETYVLKGKVMVVDYLKILHHEMYEQKLNLERELYRKEILIHDNNKFIQALESSLDENFESFSPRALDQESHLKIEALLNDQKIIELEINELQKEISKVDAHLDELETVLKDAREHVKSSLKEEAIKKKKKVNQRKIFEIQEMERQRVARNLHDSVIQSLTNMIHKIEISTKLIDVDSVRCKLELLAISKNVRDIIQDMRYIIYNLRPMSLDDITLDNMIEKEVSKIKKIEILNVSYETLGEPINISPMISLNIFRVVQEACNNIINHAKAKNVLIQVEYSEDDVEILIEDDGVGFTINDIQNLKGEEGSGFGISVMRERVYLFSGRLDVNSEPGKGTRIFVKVPIDKEDA